MTSVFIFFALTVDLVLTDGSHWDMVNEEKLFSTMTSFDFFDVVDNDTWQT